MNKFKYSMILFVSAVVLMSADEKGCINESSDQRQNRQQEAILQEAVSEIGMPAIKNFREKKMMKEILELRDQAGYITYAHLQSAQTGKLCYFGESFGYPIPYSTQFTNPQKYSGVAQADPNGLFSPASSEGTWIMMRNPTNNKAVPVYVEPRVIVAPWKMTNQSCF